jgi:hypothetical protein
MEWAVGPEIPLSCLRGLGRADKREHVVPGLHEQSRWKAECGTDLGSALFNSCAWAGSWHIAYSDSRLRRGGRDEAVEALLVIVGVEVDEFVGGFAGLDGADLFPVDEVGGGFDIPGGRGGEGGRGFGGGGAAFDGERRALDDGVAAGVAEAEGAFEAVERRGVGVADGDAAGALDRSGGAEDVGNPLFPALRSAPTAVSGASRQKQIPSSQLELTVLPLRHSM